MKKGCYKKFCISLVLALVCLLSSNLVLPDVLILTPDNEKARAVAEKIKARLRYQKVVISADPSAVPNPELVITLGSGLLRAFGEKINAPTIASFVSPSEYSTLLKQNTNPSEPVYSVVSPRSLMAFLDETFGPVRVGYIYAGEKDSYITELEILSNISEAKIVPIPLADNDVFKTLRRLFSSRTVDVMIISNDTRVFNRKNIRFVLEALYREKIPTIGFSNNLVDAGAVAAVFSEEDAMVDQTIASANTYLLTRTFGDGMYASLSGVTYKKALVDRYNISLKGNYILK